MTGFVVNEYQRRRTGPVWRNSRSRVLLKPQHSALSEQLLCKLLVRYSKANSIGRNRGTEGRREPA